MMNFKKFLDVSNEIIDILNNRDLTFLDGLLILDFLKDKILEQRSEKK